MYANDAQASASGGGGGSGGAAGAMGLSAIMGFKASQAAAKSGVVVGTGSNLLALRDTFMKTEEDAIAIRYASSIQEQAKTAQAAMIRATGASRASAIKTQAYANLLESGAKTATLMG